MATSNAATAAATASSGRQAGGDAAAPAGSTRLPAPVVDTRAPYPGGLTSSLARRRAAASAGAVYWSAAQPQRSLVSGRSLALLPLGGAVVGVRWGLSSGYEALDSAIGTGVLGLAAGALVAVGWQAATGRRHR